MGVVRKRDFNKTIKAETTGKIKRSIKKEIIPGYGKKGSGIIKDPKKSMYNAIYDRTTIDSRDVFKEKKPKDDAKISFEAGFFILAFFCFVGYKLAGDTGDVIGFVLGVIFLILCAIFSR